MPVSTQFVAKFSVETGMTSGGALAMAKGDFSSKAA
jgi:hypothetical protein